MTGERTSASSNSLTNLDRVDRWMTGFEPATSGATVAAKMIRTSRIAKGDAGSIDPTVGGRRVKSGGFVRRVSRLFQPEAIVLGGRWSRTDNAPA